MAGNLADARETHAAFYGVWRRYGLTPEGFNLAEGRVQVLVLGCRVQGSGFRVQGSGYRVQGSSFRVWGLWFTVYVQGYLAHNKQLPLLGPPQSPRYSPTVGS